MNETIEDIVREMRFEARSAQEFNEDPDRNIDTEDVVFTSDQLHDWCNRIEKAIKCSVTEYEVYYENKQCNDNPTLSSLDGKTILTKDEMLKRVKYYQDVMGERTSVLMRNRWAWRMVKAFIDRDVKEVEA